MDLRKALDSSEYTMNLKAFIATACMIPLNVVLVVSFILPRAAEVMGDSAQILAMLLILPLLAITALMFLPRTERIINACRWVVAIALVHSILLFRDQLATEPTAIMIVMFCTIVAINWLTLPDIWAKNDTETLGVTCTESDP